jgi:hypothetical protein
MLRGVDRMGPLFLVMDVVAVVALGLAAAYALVFRPGLGGDRIAAERLKARPDARATGHANRFGDWANLVLGVLVVASPFALGFDPYLRGGAGQPVLAETSAIIAGVLVIVFAVAALYRLQFWREAALLCCGLWLIVAPWAFRFSGDPAPAWSHWVLGALIVFFAINQLSLVRKIGSMPEPRQAGAYPPGSRI